MRELEESITLHEVMETMAYDRIKAGRKKTRFKSGTQMDQLERLMRGMNQE